MYQYKCTFRVNGNRTEQIVSANTAYDARQIIEAQYSGAKLIFFYAERI